MVQIIVMIAVVALIITFLIRAYIAEKSWAGYRRWQLDVLEALSRGTDGPPPPARWADYQRRSR